jgi:hypothetical protein
MNLESTRPRGRPQNRWQDEVRQDGRIVGEEEWQENVYNREEWKKLLRTATNCCILHMAMDWNRSGLLPIGSGYYAKYGSYLLTPWSRVLLEKLTALQPVKKFPALY